MYSATVAGFGHPDDAAARGISDGDLVRLHNDRGACLAAARVTDGVRAGVVQLPTGVWLDPVDPAAARPICVHGDPDVLTRDVGTSPPAHGCTGPRGDPRGRVRPVPTPMPGPTGGGTRGAALRPGLSRPDSLRRTRSRGRSRDVG
ncbi:molybdopterin dinucleotide binding domain-containing protein [Pseudonocardia tropica]|uniref:Molybdopterin dinucleotide binding domain-containing protein n=1 Tax=Pseudonocardia tropica TaxID=681289 RepID=A0ABV1JVY9_9PSEU